MHERSFIHRVRALESLADKLEPLLCTWCEDCVPALDSVRAVRAHRYRKPVEMKALFTIMFARQRLKGECEHKRDAWDVLGARA
ncbi:hypothetical protein [Demequina sp. NBRC 110055]|uniref:hypothetical protein n=1 Tax=Demequina sp. NBRC 110055 TaxID=1570344 RepID=UPI000A04F242|nr:hypothetical protein [Demequina sp. NBRC 110055]